MKKQNFVSIIGAALLLATANPTLGQSTWQTVDDYQVLPGKSASNRGVTVAPNGAIFVSGTGADAAGIHHGLVHRSLDGGATWEVVDVDPSSGSFSLNAIAVGPNGQVIAVGQGNYQGRVYGSSDMGTNWDLLDGFAPGGSVFMRGVAFDAAGQIFVCGDISEGSRWIVRRSADGGASWITVDDYRSQGATFATGITATPSGIIVSGHASAIWAVRRSTDGGNTWTTVDTFKLFRGGSGAEGAAVGANGHIYVTGYAGKAVKGRYEGHWVTRKSTDGGVTWKTVDDVPLNDFLVSQGVAVDAIGRVFACGSYGGGNVTRWLVRASDNDGATWAMTDDFALSAGSASAESVAVDAQGNVFVVGYAVGTDGVKHAIMRKRSALQ